MNKNVINAGIAFVKSLKSILLNDSAIITPTIINTADVACVGIATNNGAKNKDSKNNTPVVIAVNPVFPPSPIPAALSINAVTVDVPIKAPKRNDNKNPGRNLVYVEYLLTEDDNFAIKELPLSDSTRKVTLVHYNDSVVATLTSGADESKVEWDTTTEQVGITVTRVNNGTIRVGDYMMCEGYSKPLEVVALKLEYNTPTDMLVNADRNCKIYF